MPSYKWLFVAFMELCGDRRASFVDEDISTLTFANPQPDDPTVEDVVALAKSIEAGEA